MRETTETELTASLDTDTQKSSKKQKRRPFIKPKEFIAIAIFVCIVTLLLNVLISDLTLRHDMSAAKNVSYEVVEAINKRDGTAIWKLGSPVFQRQYSPASLTQGFQSLTIATLKMPTLDTQGYINTPQGRDTDFIYKYTALKVPFYVRIGIEHRSNHWYLTSITGNVDESQLM